MGRLERKEGVELSSLFKRKEGETIFFLRKRGEFRFFLVFKKKNLFFFFFLNFGLRIEGEKNTPNVLLITIVVRSTGSPRKLKLLLNINFPSLSIHRENQRDRIIFQPSRQNIRSRFQR